MGVKRDEAYRIRLERSAKSWDDGLPIGNGRLGGMVMGKVEEEQVVINEETLFYGGDHDRKNPDTKEMIPKLRQLLLDGKVQEAQFLARMAMTSTPKYMHPYQPAGDLRLCFFDHKGTRENYESYLDMSDATARISYEVNGSHFERTYFVSHRYQVLVIHLRACGKQPLTFSINMNRKPFEEKTGAEYVSLMHQGGVAFDVHKGMRRETLSGDDETNKEFLPVAYNCGQCGPGGVHYYTGATVTASLDANVGVMGDFLYVEQGREAVVYLACATDFAQPEEREQVLNCLKKAVDAGYETIWQTHVTEYRTLFERMDLELFAEENEDAGYVSDEPDPKSASARLELVRGGDQKEAVLLTEQLFHYARYLMISSSYDCTLPSNLQGIWNGEYVPPWQSEFTININAEMNYWAAEKANLSECHLPLFDLIDRMVIKGRETAKQLYGCRGFCAHHNTNLYANTDPEGIFEASPFWPMGGAWLSLHLYDHVLYTGDDTFLKERTLPVMREAILFYYDYLYRGRDGIWLTGPSLSPENTYRSSVGQIGALCMGPSMDIQILRELVTDYLKGNDRVQSEPEESVAMAKEILSHLPGQKMTSDGRLMEWQEEYEELEPGHRHISHLFALHPGTQITARTPELFAAANRTLETRLKNGGGHTGWSRAWIICFYARLKNGEKVAENIERMLQTCIKVNLLDTHPPFQIDGNFGLAEGILESLVQSHDGCYEFLPALPTLWRSGHVHGIVLRGAVTADFSWRNGSLTKLTLYAKQNTNCELRWNGKQKTVMLIPGKNVLSL